jgi:circadian clock protein KaiC
MMNCTTLLTSEVPPQTFRFSQYEIEEFISDGIIFLGDVERKGDLIRTLQVVKMRGTSHTRAKFSMNISTNRGIEIVPLLKSSDFESLLKH